MPKSKVLIIIPAYNEQESIKKTVTEVQKTGYDFVIINDGSTDNTKRILADNNYPFIDLPFNLGIGGAMQTGYKYAHQNNYDIAIQFDADGQHNKSYIKDIINPIENSKANLVVGSCFIDKTTKTRRSSAIRTFGIKSLSNIIRIFSGKRIYDPTSGFRAADKSTIALFANNYPLEYPEPISNFEILKFSNLKIKEVPVTMSKREQGKSSIHSWKNFYAAFNVFLSIIILSLRRKHE